MSAYSAMKALRWYLPPTGPIGFAIGAHRVSYADFYLVGMLEVNPSGVWVHNYRSWSLVLSFPPGDPSEWLP